MTKTPHYSAEDGCVFQDGTETVVDGKVTGFSMGFLVCEVSEWLKNREECAQLIADALNAYSEDESQSEDQR